MKNKDMELKIAIIPINEDDKIWAIDEASELRKEIDFFLPAAHVAQVENDIQPGDAGGAFDAVLKVLFGNSFIDKLLDIIKAWVENRNEVLMAKKPKIQISFKDERGTERSVALEGNFNNSQELIEQLKSALATA